MRKEKTIIWDFNGTLLDDLDFCISAINILLQNRGLQALDKNSYKEVFSFPVKNYYEAIGFDFEKEDFAVPAKEFIDLYDKGLEKCELHSFVFETLNYFKEKNFRQFVLSAMKQGMLEKVLEQKKINYFFEGVAGLNDHYAVSKIERGNELIEQFGLDKDNTWIIGDTIHDFEVAEELGIKCILVADGHQSETRLKETPGTVIKKLSDLLDNGEFNGVED